MGIGLPVFLILGGAYIWILRYGMHRVTEDLSHEED